MTLVDWQIQHLCGDRSYKPQWWNLKALAHKWLIPCPKNPMIAPYDPSLINAASYDLRLGDRLKIAKVVDFELKSFWIDDKIYTMKVPLKPTEWLDVDLSNGFEYWMQDDDFILSETDPIFHIPRYVTAQFALKSSRGREGYEHALAGYIDPAWHSSKLTVELHKINPNSIVLYKGLKIGQIIFTKTNAQPIHAYDERGRYNNDDGVRESKG
jgi:dCTP deaminase